MYFPDSRSVLQSLVAGAIVFAGAAACNQGDRAETGSAARGADVTRDTAMTGTGQNYGTGTATTDIAPGTGSDTVTRGARAVPGTAMGDTAPAEIQARTPREAAGAPATGGRHTSPSGDTAAAGHQAMEHDTAGMRQGADTGRMSRDTTGSATTPQRSDTAPAATDTSEISGAISDTGEVSQLGDTGAGADAAIQARVDTTSLETGVAAEADVYGDTLAAARLAESPGVEADTAASGYVAMARDTGTKVTDQSDTTRVSAADSDAIQVWVDTAQVETGVAAAADVYGDTLGTVRLDTTGTAVGSADAPESESIRVVADTTGIGVATGETADERPVATDEIRSDDRETVAATRGRTDEVGAAAVVTGAQAAALMSRQGVRCEVVDPQADREVRWDMSSTPVTLNPCGLGSMNLSRIWTEQR